jgi:hypothetical protein
MEVNGQHHSLVNEPHLGEKPKVSHGQEVVLSLRIEPRFLSNPAYCLVTMQTELACVSSCNTDVQNCTNFVWPSRTLLTFQRNLVPSFSGLKSKKSE